MTTKVFNLMCCATAAAMLAAPAVHAADPVKIGLMLPYSGTYARLGEAITNGFKLYVNENGGKLGGRDVKYYTVDDESNPSKATANASKLVKRDKVDFLVGTVHSGVAIGMAKVAKATKTLMIVPNGGANQLTGVLCAPNIFRSSFSNWQPGYATGLHVARHHETAVTLTWKYAAGKQMVDAFKEAFEKGGGKVIKDLTVPFPTVEFQAHLTEIAALKPDAVYVFFAGGGAVKFVRDYAAAGLIKSIPLYSPGFLTDGTLAAMKGDGEGLYTALHYADGLDNPADKQFRVAYQKAHGKIPDVFAVQGYDAAQMLNAGLKAANGDVKNQKAVIKGIETARIDSPRGALTISKAHNPIQNFYLRRAEGNRNPVVSTLVEGMNDPARGCKM